MASDSNIPEGLITKTETFDARTPMSKVIPSVLKYGAAIINRDNQYFGIIDSKTVYRQMQNFSVSKGESAERFAKRVPRISDSASVDDVIYYFYKARTKALPYLKNDRISGVLKRSTLIKMMLSLNRLSGMSVAQAMVNPLIGVDINATLTQARSTMRANKVNRLAVLENNKFVGLVTNYDLVSGYTSQKERLPVMKTNSYNPSNIKVESVVKRHPKSIEYNRGLKEAAQSMVENDISSLLVTRSGKPVGIVTESDIILSTVAKGGQEESKILLSGLDASTYEYEDEIRGELKAFVKKVEGMRHMSIDFISLVVKKFKSNQYELHARMSLGSQGIINAHITGHIFERTFGDLLKTLGKGVRREKERYLGIRKVVHSAHPAEEE